MIQFLTTKENYKMQNVCQKSLDCGLVEGLTIGNEFGQCYSVGPEEATVRKKGKIRSFRWHNQKIEREQFVALQ